MIRLLYADKTAVKREQSETCFDSAKREQVRSLLAAKVVQTERKTK